MQNHSKIESFFSSLDFSWQDLIEFLPIGVIFFDEHWEIKSVNRNFADFFEDDWIDIKLEGINLLSNNFLTEKLPIKEVIELKEGKHFEKVLSFGKENDVKLNLVVKGSPIFKNGIFQGGTLIIEDYDVVSQNDSFLLSANSVLSFLSKIYNCFLVLNKDGIIQLVSNTKSASCNIFNGSEGKTITDLFNSDFGTNITQTLEDTTSNNSINFLDLNSYSDTEVLDFNSVFLPITNEQNEINQVILLLRERNSADNDLIGYLSNTATLKELESFARIGTDALIKINLHGNVTYWADNASSLFQINENDIKSKFIGSIFTEITPEYFEVIRKNLLSNGIWEGYLTSEKINTDDVFRVKIISKVQENLTDLFLFCDKIDRNQQNIIAAREEEKLFFKDAVLKSNQMILQVNPMGTIVFANDKFCEDFEFELDEIRGKLFADLIETNFKHKLKITDFQSIVSSNGLEILPLYRKNKSIIEVCFNINISTNNEELKYFTIYLHECNAKDKLFLNTAHSLLYQFPQPVIIIHEDNIIKVNPQFCKLFGSELETDYFNKPIKEIVDSSSYKNFDDFLNSFTINEETKEISFLRKDKSVFQARVSKICCPNESSFSVLIIYPHELVEKKEISKSDKIKNQFENSDTFYWSGKYENSEFLLDYIDDEFFSFIGHEIKNYDASNLFWNELIHPDDISNVNSELKSILELNSGGIKELKYRLINQNGEVVWIKNKIKLVYSGDEQIKSLYGVITDVSESASEKKVLNNKIIELNRLNSAKEKFISIISHDLKSPFTSIVGFAELILTDSSLKKDDILEFVAHIKEASLHTVELLNGLVDLTKLQTGRIDIEPKIVNANFISRKTVEMLSGLAFQKGITLNSSVDNSFYIRADDNLILQVFNNLVANAIKFTPNGGNIEISAKDLPEQQKIEFTVEDNGVGIDPEDLDKLFVVDKKFTTLGTDGERGTGLGLSLVNEIVEKHNGKISVKSEIGKGSKFIFTLPISSPSILVVDGVQAERILYSRLVESITDSIEILQAKDELEAMQLINEKMPMVILVDHTLPNMNADQFISELKISNLLYQPSFILLSKEYSEELESAYRDIGVNQVFRKPFDLKEFKSKLDKIIGKVE